MEKKGPGRQYWWVSHNKTHRQEVGGGYMWSPKKQKGDRSLIFYDNMREVRPGDIVFSFYGSAISAIGIAVSSGYDCVIPPEFASTTHPWNENGWRVDVKFTKVARPLRPRDHIDTIRPHLPKRYSPLQDSGRGNMSYLFAISETLAIVLADLLGSEITAFVTGTADVKVEPSPATPVREWEEKLQSGILSNKSIPDTTKKALVDARIGQGEFKKRVWLVEDSCRITGVQNPNHLIGSHIKPWRHSDNTERLDGQNGLLLTPTVDHLFDKGYITFKNNGGIIIHPRSDREALAKMGIRSESSAIEKSFSLQQQRYLEFHRDVIFAGKAMGNAALNL